MKKRMRFRVNGGYEVAEFGANDKVDLGVP